MARNWTTLYKLQDWILARLDSVEHEFYLSGGTALSRGYYRHRYSEDLDFFVNDTDAFELWRDRCLDAIRRGAEDTGLRIEIVLREKRFGRVLVYGTEPLKIEFVNDVPSRIGEPWSHPELGLLDTKENILANKISALLDRAASKDLADIYWLCCRDGLDILKAIEGATGKAAGIFPPVVAAALEEGLRHGIPAVFWVEPPAENDFQKGIEELIRKIMT